MNITPESDTLKRGGLDGGSQLGWYRGYLKELRVSVIYGMKVLVLFTFVLILGKIRFIHDISQMSYFFLGQIFVLKRKAHEERKTEKNVQESIRKTNCRGSE